MAPAEAERDDEEAWDADEALARACRIVEALLFASVQPLSGEELAKSVPANVPIERVIAELQQTYALRGVTLHRVAGGFAFRTAPDLAYLLARASFIVSNEFHARLGEWDLTVPEWRVLACLMDLRRPRPRLLRRVPPGVLVGLAMSIKLTPGVFVVH